MVASSEAALLTDLYELTMAAAYHAEGIEGRATFDLSVRRLPEQRTFLVAAGLEQALEHLATLSFDDDAVAYLRSLGLFEESFLGHLRELRFTGDVWAVPEGEVVLAGEPLVSVTAPIVEAQIVETFLLTTVLFQTMVASKAARVAMACGGRPFADFSARRDHGAEAAVYAARAAYIGGAASTSNVLAGRRFGVPLSGTMAHAFVMAFAHEIDAFRSFARVFPNDTVLLIDTYDTEQGARRAVDVAKQLASEGVRLRGVRIDSGDLGDLARRVRRILDDGGLSDARILASGDLDEYRIAELLADGAPIDAFGVGTRMGTSADAPFLGGVYKLVDDAGGPKMKRSAGKVTVPGRKQVHRFPDRDVLSLRDEDVPGARPLLQPVMTGGEVMHHEALDTMRARAKDAIAHMPDGFPVEWSPALAELVARTEATAGGGP